MAFLPMVRLHWSLAGGTRMALLPPVALLGIVALAASVSFRIADPSDHASVAGVWIIILTVAQSVFLGLVAPSAVRKSVLRDFTSGMIESHRLTPMSNLRIVAGYLIGAAVPAMLMYVSSVVAMAYFLLNWTSLPNLGNVTVPWAASQLALIFLACTSAAIVLLTALVTSGKTNMIGILALVGVFGGWMLLPVVPGASLVLGVTSFSMLGQIVSKQPTDLRAAAIFMALSIAMQLSIALICVAGSCRKLRSPARPSFGLLLAGMLQMLAGVALVIGIVSVPYSNWLFRDVDTSRSVEIAFSTGMFVVIGYYMLIAAAHRRSEHDVRSAYEATPRNLGVALDGLPVVLALLTGLVMFLMTRVAGLDGWLVQMAAEPWRWGLVIAAAGVSYWTDYNWLYIVISRGAKLFSAIVISLVIKTLPIVVDLAMAGVRDVDLEQGGPNVMIFSAASPLGLIGIAPVAPLPVALMGLGAQVVLAGIVTTIARQFARRARRPESRPDAPLAAAAC